MLTSNLWPGVGLCNGAVGRVHQIVYNEGQHPSDLPIAVIVHFEKYAGPPFIHEHPNCIPVPPITFELGLYKQFIKAKTPTYGITIHKSQRQTL